MTTDTRRRARPNPGYAVVFAAAIAALTLLAGCQREPEALAIASGPLETVQQWYRAADQDNLSLLLTTLLPPDAMQRIRDGWDEVRSKSAEVDASDRAQFVSMMATLTADDAEAFLYQQLDPHLTRMETELASQLPLMAAMGSGFATSSIQENPQFSENQKQHATAFIGALAGWVVGAPLTDRDKARAAIAEVTTTARTMAVADLDQLFALDFDGLLAKLSLWSASAKTVFALYGLDFDASLNQARFELVSETEDNAVVRISYPLAGTELSYEQPLVRVDGRWYGADILRALAEQDGSEPQPAIGTSSGGQ